MIEELTKELMVDFLEHHLGNGYQYVVPIPSEGVALLSFAPPKLITQGPKVIFSDAIDEIGEKGFRGSQALVLDLSTFGGKMINYIATSLRGYGATTDCASLLVHDGCPVERRPKQPYYLVQHQHYTWLKEQFTEFCLERISPLDCDHFIIRLRIEPFDLRMLLKTLRLVGPMKLVSQPEEPILRLSHDVPTQAIERAMKLPRGSSLRGSVCKVRVFVDPAGGVAMVPIVFPSVPFDFDPAKQRCGSSDESIALCKALGTNGRRATSRDCFKCAALQGVIRLSQQFLHALKFTTGKEVTIDVIRDDIARTNFKAQNPLCIEELYDKVLDAVLADGQRSRPSFFRAGYQAELVGLPQDEILQSAGSGNLSYLALVAAAIYDYWEREVGLLGSNQEEPIEFVGATFGKLCEVLKDRLSPFWISQALDVLLDEGVIRPVNTLVDERENSDGYLKKWARAYRPGGEHIQKALKYLARAAQAT